MKFKKLIVNVENLSIGDLQELQDIISGITPLWEFVTEEEENHLIDWICHKNIIKNPPMTYFTAGECRKFAEKIYYTFSKTLNDFCGEKNDS
ncbi:MAG: hypothetical protein ACOC1P_00345 [Minisyncoccales bacterium]